MLSITIIYVLVFGHDKMIHFFIFFFISLSIGMIVVCKSNRAKLNLCFCIIWGFLVMLGFLEEYRQYYIPDRSTELLDALANLLGATIGLIPPVLIANTFYHEKIKTILFPIGFLVVLPLYIFLGYLNEVPFIYMK